MINRDSSAKARLRLPGITSNTARQLSLPNAAVAITVVWPMLAVN